MDQLEHTGLSFAPIATPEDLFDDPQLNAGGLVEVTLADGNKAKLPAMPVAFGSKRPGLRCDLPGIDAELADVLGSSGYLPTEVEAIIGATVAPQAATG